jgi:hypothetical protein
VEQSVGAVTVLLTILLNIFASSLGFTSEAVTQISAAVVAAGLAVIGGIALDNRSKSAAKDAPILIFLLLLPLVAGCMPGCSQPMAVRDAQAASADAFRGYANNNGKIIDLALTLYEGERGANVKRADDEAIARIKAAAVNGMLPVKDFSEAVDTLCEMRKAAADQTQAIIKKVREAVAKNNEEAAKGFALNASVKNFLEAGIDQSAIPELVKDAASLYQSFKTPPATAAPAAKP